MGRFKAFNFFPRDGLADQSLDGFQHIRFIGRHQRERITFGTGATCAANPMHVVFRDLG